MITIDELKQLNELEYEIYTYLMNNQEKVMMMKLKDVASELHVSSSMITRVCKKLSCEGFTQFKVKLRYHQEQSDNQTDNSIEYLIDYFNKVNNEASQIPIKQAASIMVKSREVIFFGVGLSGAIARYGAYLYNRKGLKCFLVDDFSYRFNIYGADTCAIVLTVSGETREVNDQIISMKEVGMKVIVITNSENTTAAKLADEVISYYVPTHKNRYFYSSATQVPVMFIFESIAKELEQLGIK